MTHDERVTTVRRSMIRIVESFTNAAFVIARKAPVAADPSQSAFHDAALEQYDKEMKPRTSLRFTIWSVQSPVRATSAHLWPGVATVGNDTLDEREAPPRLPQQRFGAVTVLYTGGVDVDVQEQALRVD